MSKNLFSFRRWGLKIALLALVGLPELAGAQTDYFIYNQSGDVLAGFRKTGAADTTANEMVADLGNVTNFLGVSAGTTITITNFSAGQLNYAFATNNNNLQWSVFSSFKPGGITSPGWKTTFGTFPNDTLWLTLPGTNVNDQTSPPTRQSASSQGVTESEILSVGGGAVLDSEDFSESLYNTNTVEVESESASYSANDLTSFIGDQENPADGDFGGSGEPLGYTVENTTPASFTAAQRSDFYQLVVNGDADPITGWTTNTYFVGYFTLNPSGTMTFTRAQATPSVTSVTATATNGFGPLTVEFSDLTGGNATNWVWNFGNGVTVTNTSGANVSATYANAGSYTVTLTVYGLGGSTTYTLTNFIVTSPQPKISLTASSGELVFSGTNCPAGVEYRILTSTNVAATLADWKPIYTNTFVSNGSFAYTNTVNTVGGANAYFILVSP